MKRPEGFDPAGKKPAVPAKQPAKQPARVRTPRPAPAPRTERVVSEVKSPRTREKPTVTRPDREARQALRRAARERRRYERGEVRRFTRRARNRRVGWLTAGGVVVLLGAMLLIAVYSPLLSLRTITIEGTSRIDPAQIQDAVDGQLGTPLALLDFGTITDELGEFPLIRSYVTETIPPDTLVIHVVEREPVAVIKNGESWDLVDPAGIVIQSSAEQPADLPLIDAGEPGGKPFTAAVEVLLELPAKMLKRVQSISATTVDDVTFTLTKTNQKVVWGSSEESDLKATTLNALLKDQKKNKDVDFNVSSPLIPLVIDETAEKPTE